ncbi:NAD(P)/FAD-dependent oxidoreductase [Acetobacter sp.]|uniref:NAD(P)/FAD-dependent oxidoreductase n=1 Tax=Acetobacter sp. TaxID=440 RepID=UPI0025BB48E1|nr:FAD-binding oxidoreductase [Acetobacter sp.]MCH4091028.1 FAD-binding oxidoreductase [Acetobacter sp.]MCI1300211.1 FAD-binding oxidoreductase [Acetobacter sp.]MCI1316121.1 FAD-binding oxidoreductase [Acetobacter sp.]
MRHDVRNSYPPSLWYDTAGQVPAFGQLTGYDRQYDVAIVGGGYTGLSTALHLAEKGLSCAVLERHGIGWGASGRNGGQVIAGLKYDPDELVALFGPDLGNAMIRSTGGAAASVFELIARYNIACHAVHNGWIQAAHCEKALARLRIKAAQWAARGVDSEILDARRVADLTGAQTYNGGWLDPRGGKIQPLLYAFGLAKAAASLGADIFVNSAVENMTRSAGRWRLGTGQGNLIARQVVLATNGYTDGLWPHLRETVVPAYSIQISTEPLVPEIRKTILPDGQALSETRRVLRYSQMDAHGRLVMGTRGPAHDETTWKDATPLIKAMHRIFPQIGEVRLDHVWVGRVGMTADHFPHLHQPAEGVHAALGYNGRGVAMATVMGRMLAQRVQGASALEIGFPVTPLEPIAFHQFSGLGVSAYGSWYRLLDRLKV